MLLDDYEEFTEQQKKILDRYVTNIRGHVFALRNLPEVIKGALLSRYSRSGLGLRSLLLKEFVTNDEETAFSTLANVPVTTVGNGDGDSQILALKKAQNFYDRILDGYGDDSIGELGGAHLAVENVSMLAAKLIEDCRVGGSPLEKSTRYIYFDQKVNDDYLFYREPIIMTSAFRDIYIDTCNYLFDTYSRLIAPVTAMFEENFPKDLNISQAAYKAALRAKVLDALRGLLPVATLTNMGVYGNGRFFEQLLHKLQINNLAEIQNIGKRAFDELTKIIPSFIRRADPSHRTHQSICRFFESMNTELEVITLQLTENVPTKHDSGVRLFEHDSDAPQRVAAALMFPHTHLGLPELLELCRSMTEEELARILDAGCSARENRRQKSPRALEHANFTFEIIADFGVYRDLQRHRILTQERQLLTCNYGYNIPYELEGTPFAADYHEAMRRAKEVYDTIVTELPEEAQYVVPMAYNIRWYFHINLRALQWLCELRSSPAGHPNYRYIAQEMAQQVCCAFPQFERFFKFVDFDGYELGRLGQEQRKVEKQLHLSD